MEDIHRMLVMMLRIVTLAAAWALSSWDTNSSADLS
jgi:hypothetical protein